MSKKNPIVSHNRSNYDYPLIIKSQQRKLKNNLLVQEEILKNTKHLQFPQKKKLQELIKMEMKLQKTYVTYYNLLIVQDFRQAHHQIWSTIFLEEFIELNVNSREMMKNMKHVELNISIVIVFLNTQILKIIQNTNVRDEKLKEKFFNTYKFSNHDKNKSRFNLSF